MTWPTRPGTSHPNAPRSRGSPGVGLGRTRPTLDSAMGFLRDHQILPVAPRHRRPSFIITSATGVGTDKRQALAPPRPSPKFFLGFRHGFLELLVRLSEQHNCHRYWRLGRVAGGLLLEGCLQVGGQFEQLQGILQPARRLGQHLRQIVHGVGAVQVMHQVGEAHRHSPSD